MSVGSGCLHAGGKGGVDRQLSGACPSPVHGIHMAASTDGGWVPCSGAHLIPVLALCGVCLRQAGLSNLPIMSATVAPGAQVVLEGLDHVLMATGRKPNTRSLGLEEVGPSQFIQARTDCNLH